MNHQFHGIKASESSLIHTHTHTTVRSIVVTVDSERSVSASGTQWDVRSIDSA